mmetsp:Transcript_18187/g.30137  ORF Transcript_18187/g.30137 Transcript_18187/m.30137 type:complete len:298 (-) Transcript_18187:140-1033(-)
MVNRLLTLISGDAGLHLKSLLNRFGEFRLGEAAKQLAKCCCNHKRGLHRVEIVIHFHAMRHVVDSLIVGHAEWPCSKDGGVGFVLVDYFFHYCFVLILLAVGADMAKSVQLLLGVDPQDRDVLDKHILEAVLLLTPLFAVSSGTNSFFLESLEMFLRRRLGCTPVEIAHLLIATLKVRDNQNFVARECLDLLPQGVEGRHETVFVTVLNYERLLVHLEFIDISDIIPALQAKLTHISQGDREGLDPCRRWLELRHFSPDLFVRAFYAVISSSMLLSGETTGATIREKLLVVLGANGE